MPTDPPSPALKVCTIPDGERVISLRSDGSYLVDTPAGSRERRWPEWATYPTETPIQPPPSPLDPWAHVRRYTCDCLESLPDGRVAPDDVQGFYCERGVYLADAVDAARAAERQQSTAQLLSDDYISGRIVAYCEMVKRGMKLASTQGVRVEQVAGATELITREGCLWRQGHSNDRWAHLWIYTDPTLVPVLDALDAMPDSPLRRFAFGKLCGYSDGAVMDFEKRVGSR